MADQTQLLERVKQKTGCASCKHFRGISCAAFPRGIPSAILSGEVPHDTPYPGDNGVMWELSLSWASKYAPELMGEEV